MKMKLNGLLVIAVLVLAGCDENEPLGIRLDWSEYPHEEMDRLIKEMGPVPKPDPRANKLWGTDLRAAIMRAQKNNKQILLAFFDSSSDHAGNQWNFIYTQPRFLDFAQKELELVKVDGSANPRADAEAQKLVEFFDVAGLPVYFVLNEEGRIVGPKNEGSFGLQPDFYNLDGVNRTSSAGTVPQSTFYFEKEKEFIGRLKLILKGTEPWQGKANIKTAGVPSSTLPSSALLAGQYRRPSELTKGELYKATQLLFFDTDLQNADLKDLAKYHQLKSLKIARSPQVTDMGLKELASFKQINELSLGGSWITDSTLKELANLEQIVRLRLTDCPNVTDKGIQELSGMKELEYVYLYGSSVTAQGKSKLSQALRKCHLDFKLRSYSNPSRKEAPLVPSESASLTDKERSELIQAAVGKALSKPANQVTKADWRKPVELRLIFSKITNTCLKEIGKLNQLKVLQLDNTRITDEGLKALGDLQQLTHLGLSGTYVTDEGIQHLHNLKNLTSITLGRTNVNIDGVATLRRALPDCDIHYFR
jgi:hypothetical protein